jgi:hypothetical protein
MADYTTSKGALNGVYPVGSIQATFTDIEPLITPQQLRKRHLFGIPLVAPFPDPITKKPMILDETDLQDTIMRAVALAESNNFFIFPRRQGKKYPWDRELFLAYGYLKLEERPVSSIQKLEIRPANNQTIFSVDLSWIETAHLAKGQVNIVPLNIATISGGGVIQGGTNSGSMFLSVLAAQGWMPAYWYAEYTVGFPDAKIPRVINEAVGIQSAILILQQLQAARALVNSQSIGLDGFSQSVSHKGGETYAANIELLERQLVALQKKIKTMFGLTMFVTNI